MNFMTKLYARTYQGIFKMAMPLLPYRAPKKLDDYDQLALLLVAKKKTHPLIVTDKVIEGLGLTAALKTALENAGLVYSVFSETNANPTVDNVESGLELYKKNTCDSIIAIGGGSSIDCAKAIGARVVKKKKSLNKMKGLLKVGRKLPLFIALPTTAGSGSETTLAAVITNSTTKHKYVINDFNLIPHYAMLDAELTKLLPKDITASTGMDALTHSIEAYIGKSSTKKTRAAALESISLILKNIKPAYNNGENLEARANMLEASYLAGVAFTRSYVGYVHAIAHSLGGAYNVAHGLSNAIILPYVLNAYNAKIYKKLKEIAVYVGLADEEASPEMASRIFLDKINELNSYFKFPKYIKELKEKDINDLVEYAYKEATPLYPTPKLLSKNDLKELYVLLLDKSKEVKEEK